jgi:hypothetical protein
LFQDGSTHRWIGTLGHDLDLIVTLDDATNWIYSAILVDEEGTMSSFLGLRETIATHGLFAALYTDRGSHSFITPKAGGKVDKGHLTQVGRALSQLGIRHIPSYSPEGRGRMERVFGTLQQRLPPELRRAGARTMEAANAYLRERFVPAFNARFGKDAAEPGSAFVVRVACWTTFCAFTSIGRSGATTACRGLVGRCRYRRSSIATTTSRRQCGCMSIRTDSSPCSTAPAAWSAMTGTELCSMTRCHARHRLMRPASPRLASCSPPSRTLRAACGGGLRPSLTAAARDALIASGEGGKTPQPNRKTLTDETCCRTTHALHNQDIFTRYRQLVLSESRQAN